MSEAPSVAPAPRKAPTPLREVAASSSVVRKRSLASLAAFVLVTASSIGIGITDAGQIDVSNVIEERNTKVAAGETPTGESETASRTAIPVRETAPSVPNGGLRGAGKSNDAPAPAPAPTTEASSTATTSDEAEVDEAPAATEAEPAGAEAEAESAE